MQYQIGAKQLAPGVYLVHESEMSTFLKASEDALVKMFIEEYGRKPDNAELNNFVMAIQERDKK